MENAADCGTFCYGMRLTAGAQICEFLAAYKRLPLLLPPPKKKSLRKVFLTRLRSQQKQTSTLTAYSRNHYGRKTQRQWNMESVFVCV